MLTNSLYWPCRAAWWARWDLPRLVGAWMLGQLLVPHSIAAWNSKLQNISPLAVTLKITGPRIAAGKTHVGPVNLLCIIIFKIRKIKPNSRSVRQKPQSSHSDCSWTPTDRSFNHGCWCSSQLFDWRPTESYLLIAPTIFRKSYIRNNKI